MIFGCSRRPLGDAMHAPHDRPAPRFAERSDYSKRA